MPNDDEARNAMNALNGQELNSRAMTATEARPRTEGGEGGRWRQGMLIMVLIKDKSIFVSFWFYELMII